MKTESAQRDLPKSVKQKLAAIRRRELGVELLEGGIKSLTVILALVVAAMLLDWIFMWFNPVSRFVITLSCFAVIVVVVSAWFLRPLFRRRTIVATAFHVDQARPDFQERWSTITELAVSNDPPQVRGSEAMIHQVALEAETLGTGVTPDNVVSIATVRRLRRWFVAAAAVFVLLFVVSFSHSKVLLQRFLLPGANISLTRITPIPGDGVVPKGEPLTLSAAIEGPLRSGSTKMFVRGGPGQEPKAATLSRNTSRPSVFEHALAAVGDSFEYRFRSGDGQTRWHQITAVDRPKISAVKLSVRPPAYSQLPAENHEALPGQLRVLHGTDIEIRFRSDQALDKMVLEIDGAPARELTAVGDNWYEFKSRPTNDLSVTAVLINKFQLQNKNKPACHISLYEDLPPAVTILEPSDDIAVRPGETVKISFEAVDDFGIAKADLIVSSVKGDETNTVVLPVALEGQAGQRAIQKEMELDLKQFGLKQGDSLSYVVQVTDTKQNSGQNSAEPQLASADTKAADSAFAENDSKTEPDRPGDNARTPERPGDLAQVGAEQKISESAAGATAKPNDAESSAPRKQPPANEMSKRNLDVAGQCSACQPRKIEIDEYAGQFEGERHAKQEMAIEPILTQLSELLAQAQEKTDSLKPLAARPQGLETDQQPVITAARGLLTESDRAIVDLKSRSSGTPYAFIGLQLHNIGEAHVAPARENLAALGFALASAGEDGGRVEKASFHITRARQLLEDLTRTYETVKRDQKVADAMQKLAKMHQIFIEDSLALLGSQGGPINSYQRKIAEVDDAYAEKLKELLEEKEKIIAELAKLLGEDPRMLRRYLAMLQLQGTTYRDQLTMLARRQEALQSEVSQWAMSSAATNTHLLRQLRETLIAEQRSVVENAVKLHEKMTTWLPLDVKPDHPQIKDSLNQTERFIKLAEATSSEMSAGNAATFPASGQEAMAQLRQVRASILGLEKMEQDHPKMAEYLANRLPEVDELISCQSAALKKVELMAQTNFSACAGITQHRLAQDTAGLADKLDTVEAQVSSMSEPIAAKAAALTKIVRTDILSTQTEAVTKFETGNLAASAPLQQRLVTSFATAETTFDELMQLIIQKLDEAPAPTAPGANKSLDDILAMLENELKAQEGLGIPCRPINVTVMKDWMKPGSSSGQGQGQAQAKAQAKAAQGKAQQAKADSERVQRETKQTARRAAQASRKTPSAVAATTGAGQAKPSESWNTLVSKLDKNILQGRDNTVPEQYRKAIENYFRIISDQVPAPKAP